MKISLLRFCLHILTLWAVTLSAQAEQSPHDRLFARALAGTKCEQIPNNGRYCTFSFGDSVEIGIKDVGGADTAVGFNNSNIKNEFYAVLYFGCIAVVPGHAHARNYDRNYGVFISPKTGLVYKTSEECRASLK
jgi:hypothetical protein